MKKGKLDILLKKIKFKLNKSLVYKKVNGEYVHKGKLLLLGICAGKGIDVGCGSDKITKETIGINLFSKGEIGKYGYEKNKVSEADIKASGDNLAMFKDSSLDYVVSRDNLEHYVDFLKALKEWNRVLKIGGKLGITTPNDNVIGAIKLDSTHKHAFNPQSKRTALELTGFKVIEVGPAIKGWSFYVIGEKIKVKNEK